MKQDFTNYMKYIGLPSDLVERVETFYGFWRVLCPEKIEWMFVTDYVNDAGVRVFDNLLFFSTNYVMEAREFGSKENFSMAKVETPLSLFSVHTENYDFRQANDASRIHFRASLTASASATLRASKENCDCLWQLIVNHFAPVSETASVG